MKALFISAAIFSTALTACGQDIPASKVPSVVQNTFNSTYASATKVEWEKKKDLYEVEFNSNGQEVKAHIDQAGKLIKEKHDLKSADLPANLVTALTTKHAGYKVDDVDLVKIDGTTYYQVELESAGKKDIKLVITEAGEEAKVPYWN